MRRTRGLIGTLQVEQRLKQSQVSDLAANRTHLSQSARTPPRPLAALAPSQIQDPSKDDRDYHHSPPADTNRASTEQPQTW